MDVDSEATSCIISTIAPHVDHTAVVSILRSPALPSTPPSLSPIFVAHLHHALYNTHASGVDPTAAVNCAPFRVACDVSTAPPELQNEATILSSRGVSLQWLPAAGETSFEVHVEARTAISATIE